MIEIKNLSKTFSGTGDTVEALKNISITIADGDIYGIIGMSGAGKSTLVRCINMLERPTEGSVLIDGCDLGTLSEAELRKIRRNVTMIFATIVTVIKMSNNLLILLLLSPICMILNIFSFNDI